MNIAGMELALRARPSMVVMILAVCCFLSSGSSLAQPPNTDGQATEEAEPDPELAELIQQLGSNRFADREAASEKLFQRGTDVLPVLRYARPSVQSHERAMRLDQLIRSLSHHDREIRIKRFLEGADDQLKNWPEMKKWFGDTKRSRELFVELYREYPVMVESLNGTPQEVAMGAFSVRQAMFVERGMGARRTARRSDILGLLLPLTDPNCQLAGQFDLEMLSLLQMQVAREFQRDVDFGEPFRELVSSWMETTNVRSREHVLRLALLWEMEIGKGLAERTLKENPTPGLLARCLQTLARQGGPDQKNVIANYLDDERIAKRRAFMGRSQNNVLVSDVAVAMIAYLSDVPVVEIGFTQPAEHELYGVVYEALALPTTELMSQQLRDGDIEAGNLPGRLDPRMHLREADDEQLKRLAEIRKELREAARKLLPNDPLLQDSLPQDSVPQETLPEETTPKQES